MMCLKKKTKQKATVRAALLGDAHAEACTRVFFGARARSWTICAALCRLVKNRALSSNLLFKCWASRSRQMCCLFFSPLCKWRHLFFPTSFSTISSCCFLHFLFISFYLFSSPLLPTSLPHFIPPPLPVFQPPSLYHFRLPRVLLPTSSQHHLLDIPALFSCSLQHNFLTHFLSPPWPPDQSLQDGIALGREEGKRETRGWRDPSMGEEWKTGMEKGWRGTSEGGTERSQGQEEEPGALSAQGQKLFLADLSLAHSQWALSAPSFLLMYHMCDGSVDMNGLGYK